MVLKYMVSDTDLVKGELKQPQTGDKQPEKKVVSDWRMQTCKPKWSSSSTGKSRKLWFFLMAIGILGAAAYYCWTADLLTPALELLPTGKLEVTAIVHGEENPSAIVSESVVSEGDVINGYKVIKIHADKVEFEKNGKTYTRKLYE
jgi:hypothetical protein